MALPKPIRPEYSTTIPSTGKKIKYQPFSVKEEKILILASESEDLDEISNAISNVLTNCVTAPSDFDPEELSLFDIEYLFLKTRAKSIGETVTVLLTDPDDETYSSRHELNIDSIKVVKNSEHTDLIDLSEEIKIKMRYPGIEFFTRGLDIDSIDSSVSVVAKCVSQIVIGEEVYSHTEMSEEEIIEWLEGLTNEQFTKIMKFFQTMPKLTHTIKHKNKKTGEFFTVTLEGLADFFQFV